MSNQELSKQLLKRIILNLGFDFNDGLLNSMNKISKPLKLQEEDGVINKFDIYAAECNTGDGVVKAAAVDIGNDSFKDLVICILQEDTLIVLRYSNSKHEHGSFHIRNKDKWVDMSILHQLNLTSAIELITQNGLIWSPTQDQDALYSVITLILSEE